MILRIGLIILATLLFGAKAHAQVTNPYFYRISKNGVDSYVLGTIHSGVSLDELPPIVLETLQKSKTLVTERAWTIEQAEREINPELVYREIVEERRFLHLRKLGHDAQERLRAYGLPKELVEVLQPSDEFCPFIIGFAAGQRRKSIDFEIVIAARHRGISIEELETEQLRQKAVEAAGKHICNVGDLVRSESAPASVRAETSRQMESDYRTGRLPIFPENAELRYRNERWIPKIEDLHSKGSIFIFVGAHHVMQPANIVEMLQARGFVVKRLKQ